MDKYYAITMSNGDKYGVPADIIAENKADYYASGDDDEWVAEYEAMIHFFDTNNYEFADWAKGNMNWDDVKDKAILISSNEMPVDFQECWVNGEYEYVTTGKTAQAALTKK